MEVRRTQNRELQTPRYEVTEATPPRAKDCRAPSDSQRVSALGGDTGATGSRAPLRPRAASDPAQAHPDPAQIWAAQRLQAARPSLHRPCACHSGSATASDRPGYLGLLGKISTADAAILKTPSPATACQLRGAQPMTSCGRKAGRAIPRRGPALALRREAPGSQRNLAQRPGRWILGAPGPSQSQDWAFIFIYIPAYLTRCLRLSVFSVCMCRHNTAVTCMYPQV